MPNSHPQDMDGKTVQKYSDFVRSIPAKLIMTWVKLGLLRNKL